MNCRQKCQIDGSCHFCNLIFDHITYIDRHKEELAEEYGVDLIKEKPQRSVEEIKQHIEELLPLVENENEQLKEE